MHASHSPPSTIPFADHQVHDARPGILDGVLPALTSYLLLNGEGMILWYGWILELKFTTKK